MSRSVKISFGVVLCQESCRSVSICTRKDKGRSLLGTLARFSRVDSRRKIASIMKICKAWEVSQKAASYSEQTSAPTVPDGIGIGIGIGIGMGLELGWDWDWEGLGSFRDGEGEEEYEEEDEDEEIEISGKAKQGEGDLEQVDSGARGNGQGTSPPT